MLNQQCKHCSFRIAPDDIEKHPVVVSLKVLVIGVIFCTKGPKLELYSQNKELKFKEISAQVCSSEGQLCLYIPFPELKMHHLNVCDDVTHRVHLTLAACFLEDISQCPYDWMKDVKNRALVLIKDIQTSCFPSQHGVELAQAITGADTDKE